MKCYLCTAGAHSNMYNYSRQQGGVCDTNFTNDWTCVASWRWPVRWESTQRWTQLALHKMTSGVTSDDGVILWVKRLVSEWNLSVSKLGLGLSYWCPSLRSEVSVVCDRSFLRSQSLAWGADIIKFRYTPEASLRAVAKSDIFQIVFRQISIKWMFHK